MKRKYHDNDVKTEHHRDKKYKGHTDKDTHKSKDKYTSRYGRTSKSSRKKSDSTDSSDDSDIVRKDDKGEKDSDSKLFFIISKLSKKHSDTKHITTKSGKTPDRKPVLPCKNPLCNHKTIDEDPTPVDIPNIEIINTISDLIVLGKSYHCKKNTEHNGINLRIMCNLVAPLSELERMVGMLGVKTAMVDQILFFLQGYHTAKKCNTCTDCAFNLACTKNQSDMLHTVISGPPGVGKTEVAKILGKVYKEMEILTGDAFVTAKRSDLIGSHCGETAMKTQDVIDKSMGGVLFIDEAYSLGNTEKRDVFTGECIDTINLNLNDVNKKGNFLCIIAGYKEELETRFFNYNEGLKRRFSFSYDIIPYEWQELKEIFERKVILGGFNLCYKVNDLDDETTIKNKTGYHDQIEKFFEKNKNKFPYNGGDIETLFLNCKIAHARGMVSRNKSEKYTLSVTDIKRGFDTFVKNRNFTKDDKDNKNSAPPFGMYL